MENKIHSKLWSFSSEPSLVSAEGFLCENVTVLCAAAEGSLGLHCVSQGSLMEFEWNDAPDNFLKKLKTNSFVFLKHLFLSFGAMLSAGLQRKTRFGSRLVLAFLEAAVGIGAGTC